MDLCFLPERQLLFAAQDLQEMKDCNQITAEYGLQLPPPWRCRSFVQSTRRRLKIPVESSWEEAFCRSFQ